MLYKLDSETRKELKRREEELNRLRREGKLTDQKILEPFNKTFPNERACLDYLLSVRWGKNLNRFRCPHKARTGVECGGRELKETSEGRFRCTKCHAFISIKTGTLFQDSKLTLRQWFMAMWFMAYREWGLNALEVQRLLGIGSYRIALDFLHKVRRAMSGENLKPLRGKDLRIMKIQIQLGSSSAWLLVVYQENYYILVPNKNREGDPYERQFPPFVRLKHLSQEDSPLLPLVTEWTKQALEKRKIVNRKIVVWTEEDSTDQSWSKNYDHQVATPASDKHGIYFASVQLVVDQLRKWLSRNFRSHVQTTYLQRYLDEFAFWYNRHRIWSQYHEYTQPTYRWLVFDQLLQKTVRTGPRSKKIG
jgi:hypothetical protein